MSAVQSKPSTPGRPAMFFTRLEGDVAQCGLCPRGCRIPPGGVGACQVRRNEGGALVADSYGRPVALQIDPIEKKPLSAYLPETLTFSIGTFGCNLACAFCQNHHLSRQGGALQRAREFVEPETIVAMAKRTGCRSVAFTYNEPTTFIEYAIDIARLARAAGLGTVLVSNGFISAEARAALYPLIDAANIDVKGFSEAFYSLLCDGSLAPVLESCRYFKREVGGHLEITNLLIPNRNDSPEMIQALLDWMADAVGLDTPLHFSAYRPMGGFTEPPTPVATVRDAVEMASKAGFTRVATGNI
ncbi:MAG: AmmeMemoRadiSam system radical SAM enzyme [Kiritimatiellia bacterium]|jgi:pyruvate formate lyase activating enzyme